MSGIEQGKGKSLPGKKQMLIVAAIALAASLLYLAFSHKKADLNEPGAEASLGTFRPTRQQWDSFKIETVRKMTFRTRVSTEGIVAYDDDASTQVFSPYSGRITAIHVKAGDFVKKGQALMTVAATEYVQAENDFLTAASALSTAKAQWELARKSEERLHQLYLVKGASLKDWQQSQADLVTAENNFNSGRIALESVRNRLRIFGKTDAEISGLERSKAGPDVDVVAPVSGVVLQRQAGIGQYINSAAGGASSPLFVIGDVTKIWIVANVRESDAHFVHVGEEVEAHVLAYPGEIFRAKIAWVGTSIDPNTRRLPVRAVVDNLGGRLKALMYASFDINAGEDGQSPGIPQGAIVFDGSEARVFVALDSGEIAPRKISTGRINKDGMVEVTGGLSAGEKIVTAGTLFIDRTTKE